MTARGWQVSGRGIGLATFRGPNNPLFMANYEKCWSSSATRPSLIMSPRPVLASYSEWLRSLSVAGSKLGCP